MKNTCKRVLSLVLMLMLVVSLAAPAFAYDNLNAKSGKVTVYLTSKTDKYCSLQIAQWSGNETNYTIKKPTVTAGTSGATLRNFSLSRTTYTYNYYGDSPSTNKSYNGYASVSLDVEKAGTAKIKYTVGGVSKTINLTIKNYVNPIKTITLTGANNSQNFASRTKNSNYMSQYYDDFKPVMLNANTKSAKLKVVPADGWKITNVDLEDVTTGLERSISNYNTPMSSATISWGTLNAKHNYNVYANLVNTSNGATQYVNYLIHGANADDNYY